MTQIADAAGLGRATLYKYFAGVEQVVSAWHHRQVDAHVAELAALADRTGTPVDRLRAVLRRYAEISSRPRHGGDLVAATLHTGDHVQQADARVRDLIGGLIRESAEPGGVRVDVPAGELAGYCVHALGAAAEADSPAARERLVEIVWSSLEPRRTRTP